MDIADRQSYEMWYAVTSGRTTLGRRIHYSLRFINSSILFELKKVPDLWKESVIVSVYMKGDETD
jgi:hypothetical protein